MGQNMTVPCGTGLINIRAGAIIMKDGKILMAGNDIHPEYMYTVGGRLQFGETAEEAVRREVYEETGVLMEPERLGFIHEGYFISDLEEYPGIPVYEINYYFYMKVPEDFAPAERFVREDGHEEYLKWLSLDDPIFFFPEFFREELKHPEPGVKHYVTDDR